MSTSYLNLLFSGSPGHFITNDDILQHTPNMSTSYLNVMFSELSRHFIPNDILQQFTVEHPPNNFQTRILFVGGLLPMESLEWNRLNSNNRTLTSEHILDEPYGIVTPNNQSVECYVPPPLSKLQINKLKTFKITKKDLSCPICMEYLKLNCRVKQLPCNHYFHKKCITNWFKRQATCPNCRKHVRV